MFQKLTIMLLFLSITLFGQTVITVTDADIQPGQTVNWTANNTYLLDGFVFVDDGAVLNIQAGTSSDGGWTSGSAGPCSSSSRCCSAASGSCAAATACSSSRSRPTR